jgi:hypothetical protein
MNNVKCPYCESECIFEDDAIIEWECGSKLNMKNWSSKPYWYIIEPTKECKAITDEKLKVNLTDVGQYVAGLKEIEDLFPDPIHEPFLPKQEKEIDPHKKEIINLFQRISNQNSL